MADRRQQALDYHTEGRPGKIEVVPTKSLSTQHELTLAYSPGVAEPCREIAANPNDVFTYTARGNLVAVVSNGTAVLGLGNIGPLAAKPVMEGKAVLFKRFAGIDVFDIEVDSSDAQEVIRFCEMLSPTVAGHQPGGHRRARMLRHRARPAEVARHPRLPRRPARHRHHRCRGAPQRHRSGRQAHRGRARGLQRRGSVRDFHRPPPAPSGANPDNVILCDSRGVIYRGREDGMNEYKTPFAVETGLRTLEEALDGADIFIGLSVKGIMTTAMVSSMARDPVIFALANPDPEILPEDVAAVRGDAIMATGRSDYPNQVNNVLGFPFIFRGAIDVRARGINPEMMLAATRALAELARLEVPEAVRGAYGKQDIRYGRDYLIPKPFDHRVLFHLAPAVAKAAMETGMARVEIDLDEYLDRLQALLGPGRQVMAGIRARARNNPARVVFPEGHNLNVIRAAAELAEAGICRPVLLGRPPRVAEKAGRMGLDMTGVEVVYAAQRPEARHDYAQELFQRRARKGLTLAEAQWNLYKPIYFALSMVESGEADAIVAGVEANYAEILRPALQVIGAKGTCGWRASTCWPSAAATWCSWPTPPSTSTPTPRLCATSLSRPPPSCATWGSCRRWPW